MTDLAFPSTRLPQIRAGDAGWVGDHVIDGALSDNLPATAATVWNSGPLVEQDIPDDDEIPF